MRFTVTMKNSDALDYALEDLEELLNEDDSLDEDDKRDKLEEAREFAKEYMEWSEYIRVEFDTEAKTATVLKA
jgi:uncharacterized LabA/DUF88 family protein